MTDRTSALHRHGRMRSADMLLLVLGVPLTRDDSPLRRPDRQRDAILIAEVREQTEHVPSHRQRTSLFLSGMRHHAIDVVEAGYSVRNMLTRAQMTWAQRLRRVFVFDLSRCPRCGAALRVLAVVMRPRVVAAILSRVETRAVRAPLPPTS